MLNEDQVAKLLQQCERLTAKPLTQIRGNLRKAESCAAAIWELLVIDALARIGAVEYEPLTDGCPDLRIQLPNGRALWLEAAFLYPRFWDEERKSQNVIRWIYKEAECRGIDSVKISYRLDGSLENAKGPVRTLPELNVSREGFLKSSGIIKFFEDIQSAPHDQHSFSSCHYSIVLSYCPNAKGEYIYGGGLVQEAAKSMKEHAVFRVLKEKARQHDVVGPRVICLGSDQSPALSHMHQPGQPTFGDAIAAIFVRNRSLSAVLIVCIESVPKPFGQTEKQARCVLFENPKASEPLSVSERELIKKLDFNRWRYTAPIEKWAYHKPYESHKRVLGSLTYRPRGGGMEVEVPSYLLVQALAGKTSLAREFDLPDSNPIMQALNEDWEIESCHLKIGSIENGEPPTMVLGLIAPQPSIFGSDKK